MTSHVVSQDGALLAYMVEHFKDLKRTKLKQLLKYGAIEVGGQVVKAFDHPLKKGEKLRILDKHQAVQRVIKTKLPFPIVHEDESLIVIDKPSGLLSAGTDQEKIQTAYYQLNQYMRPGKGRVLLVHRLDRDASGLLMFAKNEKTKDLLQTHWTKVIKKYYALVEGEPERRQGTIESHLVEDKFRRVYSTQQRTRESKHARTHYEVLRTSQRYCLLDVQIDTGRKNQIRVHLADLGHPIVGDEKYGSTVNPAGRLGLHAYSLQFQHPETRVSLHFESKMPSEFARLVP